MSNLANLMGHLACRGCRNSYELCTIALMMRHDFCITTETRSKAGVTDWLPPCDRMSMVDVNSVARLQARKACSHVLVDILFFSCLCCMHAVCMFLTCRDLVVFLSICIGVRKLECGVANGSWCGVAKVSGLGRSVNHEPVSQLCFHVRVGGFYMDRYDFGVRGR